MDTELGMGLAGREPEKGENHLSWFHMHQHLPEFGDSGFEAVFQLVGDIVASGDGYAAIHHGLDV